MTPAAMCTTVVFTMVMLVVVVAASYVRIEFQRSVEQFFDGIISTARDTAIEVDRGFCQALFGSAADTAGNDSIDFLGLQESTNAPWPWPFVSTTSALTIFPSSTS